MMAHDGRLGLITLPSVARIMPSYTDARQWILAAAAARRWMVERFGGPGVYAGGAAALGDLPTGTRYPPVDLAIVDDGDQAWLLSTAGEADITFELTDGAGALYAVVETATNPAGELAVGGLTNVLFIARDQAAPAPGNSLLLGTGTIASSAFTDWTEDGDARVSPDLGLVSSVFERVGDVVATAGDYAASQISDDSSLAAGTVKDALEALDGAIGDLANATTTALAGKSDVGHTHDDRYFREDEHLATSAGAGSAGQPVKLDAEGRLDPTMLRGFTVDGDGGTPQAIGSGGVLNLLGGGAVGTFAAPDGTVFARALAAQLAGAPTADGGYDLELMADRHGALHVWPGDGYGYGGAWEQRSTPITDGEPAAESFVGGAIPTGYTIYDRAVQAFKERETARWHICRRYVKDTKFGPPPSGVRTWAPGDEWIDAADSLWRCTVAGDPGTWVQPHPGYAATWTGGGSDDITTAANWNGGALLTGYRVNDGTEEWRYNSTYSKWMGRRFSETMPFYGGTVPPSATTANLLLAVIDQSTYNLAVHACSIRAACTSADGSNYWTMDLKNGSGTTLGTGTKNTGSTTYHTITPASGNVIQAYTVRTVALTVTKTGSPDPLYIGASLLCSLVRR